MQMLFDSLYNIMIINFKYYWKLKKKLSKKYFNLFQLKWNHKVVNLKELFKIENYFTLMSSRHCKISNKIQIHRSKIGFKFIFSFNNYNNINFKRYRT